MASMGSRAELLDHLFGKLHVTKAERKAGIGSSEQQEGLQSHTASSVLRATFEEERESKKNIQERRGRNAL